MEPSQAMHCVKKQMTAAQCEQKSLWPVRTGRRTHRELSKLELAVLEAYASKLLPPRQVHALAQCLHSVWGGILVIVCIATGSCRDLMCCLHSPAECAPLLVRNEQNHAVPSVEVIVAGF